MTDLAQTAPSLRPGVVVHEDGAVSFGLYAPFKQTVHLIGDFNGWDLDAAPMTFQPDGLWTARVQLEPGLYGYQFLIDRGLPGEVTIADPYSTRLRWVEGRDQPHSLVEVGAAPYVWGDQEFRIKPLNELLIYELHVGDFSPEGTFKGVTARLDYIRDLGVNAIELMPVQEFPGDRSWGYNPAYYFCPESTYGTVKDLKELVDQAHQRGIGILLDMVFNHTDASNPLTRLYAYQDNPYYGEDGNPWGFPDIDHWNDATKHLIHDIQAYWLDAFHVDGFRYDNAEGIGYDFMSGIQYIAWDARETKHHAYLIAENIPDPVPMVLYTDIDASWHESFQRVARAQLREGEFEGVHYGDMHALLAKMDFRVDGYTDNAQAVNYLESHDQQRLAYEIRTNPALDIDEAVAAKSKLGALLLFTAAGVPMLYAGQELGTGSPRTIDQNRLDWDRLNAPIWEGLRRWYVSLAYLRAQNRALRLNNFEPLLVDPGRKLLAFKRWDDGGNQIVVALNFAPYQQFAELDFPRGGRWHEWTYDYDEDLGGSSRHTVELPPSGGKVWVAS